MRIRLYGEGLTDIGSWTGDGVIPPLVQKVLKRSGRHVDLDVKPRPFRRVHQHGFKAKIAQAMKDAQKDGADAVVAVVDRDTKGSDRLKAMKKGRERERQRGNPIPCALGLAIECVEAWVLTPEAARAGLGLDSNPEEPKHPESLSGKRGTSDHPKQVFESWLAAVPDGRFESVTDAMAAVAEATDLKKLEKRCPKGFRPFAEELRVELLK